MKQAIGIIGGVGPYAGLDLNKKIFDNIKNNGSDQDYLDVYLVSRSSDITDRTSFLKHNIDTNPAEGLFRSALELERAGVKVMAIPCNTAHSKSIYTRLEELMILAGCKAKLLHIVKETHSYLEKNHPNMKKIGMLGTLGTYESKLYENYFKEQNKFELINPKEEGKKRCHDAIYNKDFGVKAFSSPVTEKAKSIFKSEIDELIEQGAEGIILGCTEIPLAFENIKTYKDALLIDPTNILAIALIKKVDKDCLIASV